MRKREGEFLEKRRSQTEVCDLFNLSFYFKTVFATGADDRVLSPCLRQAEYSAALRTFAIHVRLAIANFVATQTEKSAEAIVFATTFLYVAREHTEEDDDDERNRQKIVRKGKNDSNLGLFIGNDHRHRYDIVGENKKDVDAEQCVVERISPVSSVHKASELVFDFTHSVSSLIIRSGVLLRDLSSRQGERGSNLQ